jgi:hypothetical protein
MAQSHFLGLAPTGSGSAAAGKNNKRSATNNSEQGGTSSSTGRTTAAMTTATGSTGTGCPYMPNELREELLLLRGTSTRSGGGGTSGTGVGGKHHWAKTAEVFGVYEDEHGLRLRKTFGLGSGSSEANR